MSYLKEWFESFKFERMVLKFWIRKNGYKILNLKELILEEH
jgi:hypothetical protein